MTANPTTERPTRSGQGVQRRLAWRKAIVIGTMTETTTARTLILGIDDWSGHLAGQHMDVRLTAEDGYQATRSYSLSSAPDEPPQITVERVTDGEVSPHLVDVIERGDDFEIRGPIGGYFVWQPVDGDLLLIGGGSGIAPLRAMWRHRSTTPTTARPTARTTVMYSARAADRVIFADELATEPNLDVRIHLTRETRPDHRSGRIGRADLASVIGPANTYVCGPTGFVEAMSAHLIDLGVDPRTIRTERFG